MYLTTVDPEHNRYILVSIEHMSKHEIGRDKSLRKRIRFLPKGLKGLLRNIQTLLDPH